MPSHARVFNVTRRFYMNRKQAACAVENCACAWVEFGVSLRDLTLAEAIAARNRQARMSEPLPCVELPGLVYRPVLGSEQMLRMERAIARDAESFAQSAAY